MNQPNFPHYRVYLLRLWQEQTASPEQAPVWRLMLEDPKTGQRRGFDGLESLLAFLRTEMDYPMMNQKSKQERGDER